MKEIERRNKIIGITRIRNEAEIIQYTLDHLSKFLDGVVIYEDCSTDDTLEIIEKHPLVLSIIKGKKWESDPKLRAAAEGIHRQKAYETALNYSPSWIYVFDADEFVELKEDLDLNDLSKKSYFFRLFDYYITSKDKNQHFLKRKKMGPEYREIPMLFHSSTKVDFVSRVPSGLPQSFFGGYVKHYGKAISIEEWEKTCHYYINHLEERQPGNSTISQKWSKRIGKAVHKKSDFNNTFITWDEKENKSFLLNEESYFRNKNYVRKILLLIRKGRQTLFRKLKS